MTEELQFDRLNHPLKSLKIKEDVVYVTKLLTNGARNVEYLFILNSLQDSIYNNNKII